MITIQPARFWDYAAIAALHASNWKQTYRGILSDNYLDHEVEKDRLNTWYERFTQPAENQFVGIAIQDEKLAGFCCLFLNDDLQFGSLIDNLHVAAGARKQGIGKMLLADAAKTICSRARNHKMYLWVYETNNNARLAYEKMGGVNFESFEKENEEGVKRKTCRYVWDDAAKLITS